jgi:hypothetical protein
MMKTTTHKYFVLLIIALFIVLMLLSGCTAEQHMTEIDDSPGFLLGLWHGFILLFTFIGSLFSDIEVYSFPNNGGWYNFGFLLGVMIFFGGGGSRTGK